MVCNSLEQNGVACNADLEGEGIRRVIPGFLSPSETSWFVPSI